MRVDSCYYTSLSHVQTKEYESGSESEGSVMLHNSNHDGNNSKLFPTNEARRGSPDYKRSYGDAQLEIFHHWHGLLVLHLFAALMFVPSLVAWLQWIGIGQSFPWFWDSVLSIGVVLHSLCDSKPVYSFYFFLIPGIPTLEFRLSFCLSPCWIFFVFFWVGSSSVQSVLCNGCNRNNLIRFQNHPEEEQAERRDLSLKRKAFPQTLIQLEDRVTKKKIGEGFFLNGIYYISTSSSFSKSFFCGLHLSTTSMA